MSELCRTLLHHKVYIVPCLVLCLLFIQLFSRAALVKDTGALQKMELHSSSDVSAECLNGGSCMDDHDGEPRLDTTGFVKGYGNGDVNDKIVKLEEVLKKYLSGIKDIRKRILDAGAQWKNYDQKRERVVGYQKGFFDKLLNYPAVDTVFMKESWSEMKKLLIPTYYEYTSNNCDLVEKHSVYGQHMGKTMFNIECHGDLSVHLKGHPLQENHLSINLPDGFQQELGGEKRVWTYLHVVKNAVVSKNGDVITSNLTLVPQRCKENKTAAIPSKATHYPLYDEVFSVHQYWGTAFYHSSLEGMPRLTPYLQFLADNPHIKINYNFKNPFFPHLHIPDAESRRVGQEFRAKILYSPAGGICGRSPLLNTQLLSLYLRRSLPNNPRRNKIILIKRSKKRYFKHHNEILAMLQKEASVRDHLEVTVFRDDPVPTLNDTMHMFNQAIMVVAPHGAGESNLLFTQPGTVVIEGLCWDELHRGNLCYRNVAQVLGLRYHALFYSTQCMHIGASEIQKPVKFFLQHLQQLHES